MMQNIEPNIFERVGFLAELITSAELKSPVLGDGQHRFQSAGVELAVAELLGDRVVSQINGGWCDFTLNGHPINLKVTTAQGMDNISSVAGLLYAITGLRAGGQATWPNFLNHLHTNIDEEGDSDYHFLVLNKVTGKCFATSMMRLNSLGPNGNNLPFQCHWGKHDPSTVLSRPEQIGYLIRTLGRSLALRAEPAELFNKLFS